MDPRERFEDTETTSRVEDDGRRAHMWTSLPGIVQEHDVEKNTVTALVATKMQRAKPDGTTEWVQVDKLVDLPIQYPSGGGATMTLPMKKGDEVLLSFSARAIDKWWQEGGVQEQDQYRMHSMQDGFAIPGFRSQPRKLKNVNPSTLQIRTDDGNSYVEFDPVNKKYTTNVESDVLIQSATSVTLKAPLIVTDGPTRLGSASASIQVSKQGTVDSRGDTDTSNFAPNVYVSSILIGLLGADLVVRLVEWLNHAALAHALP